MNNLGPRCPPATLSETGRTPEVRKPPRTAHPRQCNDLRYAQAGLPCRPPRWWQTDRGRFPSTSPPLPRWGNYRPPAFRNWSATDSPFPCPRVASDEALAELEVAL